MKSNPGWRIFLLLLAVNAASAQAEMPGSRLFQKGDAGMGACAACHAVDGAGSAQLRSPAVAGQPAAYLTKQLLDFRTDLRSSPDMTPIAQRLNASQITAVTGFIAALQPPAPIAGNVPERGRQLALFGKWDVGIPPCDKCHGTDGGGIPPHFPVLSGQIADYTRDTLEAFRNNTRRNDPLELMRRVVKRLSREEAAAVAQYYQARRREP